MRSRNTSLMHILRLLNHSSFLLRSVLLHEIILKRDGRQTCHHFVTTVKIHSLHANKPNLHLSEEYRFPATTIVTCWWKINGYFCSSIVSLKFTQTRILCISFQSILNADIYILQYRLERATCMICPVAFQNK